MKKNLFLLILPLAFSCNNTNVKNEACDVYLGNWKGQFGPFTATYKIEAKGSNFEVTYIMHNGKTKSNIAKCENSTLMFLDTTEGVKYLDYKKDGNYLVINGNPELTHFKKELANSKADCNEKETYIGKWKNVKDGGIMKIEDNGNNLRIKDDNGQDFTAVIKEDCTLQTTIMVGISYIKTNGHLVWVNGEYEKIEE